MRNKNSLVTKFQGSVWTTNGKVYYTRAYPRITTAMMYATKLYLRTPKASSVLISQHLVRRYKEKI